MRENKFQQLLIKEIKNRFDGCMVLKNDPNYIQGIPDLTVLYKNHWAFLEVKASVNAPERPNQKYYCDWARRVNGYGFIITPDNKEDILYAMAQLWK